MEKEDIMLYIGAWSWNIISMIFLTGALIIFSLERNTRSKAMYVGLFILFIVAQFFAWKRQQELIANASSDLVVEPLEEDETSSDENEEDQKESFIQEQGDNSVSILKEDTPQEINQEGEP